MDNNHSATETSEEFIVKEEIINTILAFMGRVDLKGSEVPAFNSSVNFIHSLIGMKVIK